MRLLQLILIATIFLAVLCGPALLVARGLWRRGYPRAPRCLRVIVPAQLVLALGIIALGESWLGYDLAPMIVVVTAATSALGALAMWALGALFPSRLI